MGDLDIILIVVILLLLFGCSVFTKVAKTGLTQAQKILRSKNASIFMQDATLQGLNPSGGKMIVTPAAATTVTSTPSGPMVVAPASSAAVVTPATTTAPAAVSKFTNAS